MFHKILIANRGEIAVRIARTARKMGVATVAVYSDADAGAAHVAACDESVHIGGPQPADSYLRGDVIIAAALERGAQAIHPGYGFLSENPDFVDAVEAAGLTFIGPSADAIRAMGLKDAAKALMEKAGVPVVPGYHGDEQHPKLLAGEADQIGYPVLIKAVAGGGGKGMRLIERPEDFADGLASAQREAQAAFGNPAVLVEKYILKPRHIEVQVFGDGTDAVHLFERDCSLQRRHQKVIEEAPAPGMTDEMRTAMGQAAVRAAKTIGYKGAGTVEFIVAGADGLRPDGFWFMEMNTRLQVEHPVTEAITGVDLVEWQLRVAAGEPLPAAQGDLHITGHAFEARLYAEDAANDFLPATGSLDLLRFPKQARIDSGVREGDVISPFYDPMIAKITTHGPTREIALSQLTRALEGTDVGGTVTNLAFLRNLTLHDGFAGGDVDTGLIERDGSQLTQVPEPPDAAVAAGALAAAAPADDGFTLWSPLRRTVSLERNDPIDVVLEITPSGTTAQIGDRQVQPAGYPTFLRGRQVHVCGPVTWSFSIIDPLDVVSEGAAGNVITAPMPGLVRDIFVEPGASVAKGERLAILEAMKMEHALLAARDGTVSEVLAQAGDQVEAGAALIALEEEE
ncbi:acetyl/propionyl/methylcrotonyl-CoA carboxylase subunit alpha [Aliiroseovarius sp. PTFE2010]|uniref:acetyl/propionyl/methylcrotonyl-CoA carboxylase subunit alpha n=1 Tax=Aliiroseovarius sp. PTFE2010 TaxID=3417190 RepID=UPI003CEE94C6